MTPSRRTRRTRRRRISTSRIHTTQAARNQISSRIIKREIRRAKTRRTRTWMNLCPMKWTTPMRTASGTSNFRGREKGRGKFKKMALQVNNYSKTCTCSGSPSTPRTSTRATKLREVSSISPSTVALLRAGVQAIEASRSSLLRQQGAPRLSNSSTTQFHLLLRASLQQRRRASRVSHLSTAATRKTGVIPIPITQLR